MRDASQEHDNFGQHQFSNAAGVGEWRVKRRNAALSGRIEIDLISADAEASDADQARRMFEKLRR